MAIYKNLPTTVGYLIHPSTQLIFSLIELQENVEEGEKDFAFENATWGKLQLRVVIGRVLAAIGDSDNDTFRAITGSDKGKNEIARLGIALQKMGSNDLDTSQAGNRLLNTVKDYYSPTLRGLMELVRGWIMSIDSKELLISNLHKLAERSTFYLGIVL